MTILYLGHPVREYEGDVVADVVEEFVASFTRMGWEIRPSCYVRQKSLDARDFTSMVLQQPGPVLLLGPVQQRVVELVRQRIGTRTTVDLATIFDRDALTEAVDQAIAAFDAGEPRLSMDVVVALLMIRKLAREQMWSGNAKGYMWADDIPKGRGLDEKYAARVPNVVNVLLNHGYLVRKTSQHTSKYALNPERRAEIHGILRDRRLPRNVEAPLARGALQESVRALDLLGDFAEYE